MDLFKAAHWLFLLDPLAKAGFCLLSRGVFPSLCTFSSLYEDERKPLDDTES